MRLQRSRGPPELTGLDLPAGFRRYAPRWGRCNAQGWKVNVSGAHTAHGRTMALHVFISYSSRDREDALCLKEIAEAEGHDAWMDLFDIQPAARLARELEEGVSSADVLCLL